MEADWAVIIYPKTENQIKSLHPGLSLREVIVILETILSDYKDELLNSNLYKESPNGY